MQKDEKLETDHTWRLSKNVTVGHIVSATVLCSSLFLYLSSVDKRIEQNTRVIHDYATIKERVNKHAEAIDYLKQDREEIKADLRAINAKLDRLIERQGS